MSIITRNRLFIIAGTVSTAIGIIGIFVPILPTTPFLLLAAACYLRGSAKFYRWLLTNRVFGFYIKNYLEGKGMPLKTKIFTLCLLWITISLTSWLAVENLAVRIILGVVAIGVTWHIISIKRQEQNGENMHEREETTRDTYNRISTSWYNYRHRSRYQTELEELAGRWGRGKLLNVGCAHGADFPPFKESFELYGVDYATEMLKLAEKYAAKNKFRVDLKKADAGELPYANDFFDYAIAVAIYHHIEDKAERLQAVKELYRVMKPGGEAFLTVWNRWQPRHWLKRKSVMHPWKTKGGKVYRFYYLFTYGEFEKLVRQAGFEIIRSYPEYKYKFPIKMFSRNICLLVRKKI